MGESRNIHSSAFFESCSPTRSPVLLCFVLSSICWTGVLVCSGLHGQAMLEETEDFGLVFGAWASFLGCLLWTGCWAVSHRLLPPFSSAELDLATRFYRRKLHRMLIYCSLASMVGASFFLQCLPKNQPTQCMLMSFGPAQQFFFWMAVGHWSCALWEDWRSRDLLGQGLTVDSGGGLALFPLNLCCSSAQVMYLTYTVHHVITIFAYIYALASHQMGGVMIQGLLFELPVVWMLRRELGHSQKPKPPWLQKSHTTHVHLWLQEIFGFFFWVHSFLKFPTQQIWEHLDIIGNFLCVFFFELELHKSGIILVRTWLSSLVVVQLKSCGSFLC